MFLESNENTIITNTVEPPNKPVLAMEQEAARQLHKMM
jgi:hypothetical protein